MKRTREWSDWAGFTVFTFLWVLALVNNPGIGVMMAPLVLHPLLSSVGFLLRKPLISSAPGFFPRLAGYGTTFGVLACYGVFQAFRPGWLAPTAHPHIKAAGVAIWLLGAVLDLWALWWLRHGMSIVPQARTLITGGPYRYARHPLYTAYIVQNIGLWLRVATFPMALVLFGWFVVTLARVRYEEDVLSRAFPGYEAYRYAVGMFMPRLANFRLQPSPAQHQLEERKRERKAEIAAA
jgi:protein-S-isoprenylcysteine O-methyltransferase Ste14